MEPSLTDSPIEGTTTSTAPCTQQEHSSCTDQLQAVLNTRRKGTCIRKGKAPALVFYGSY